MRRPRLTYANVTATLALVLAIGGTSYAAVQLNGKSLKNRTVAGQKLKKNTVTGTEVKESKLGKVPLSARADSAATADAATNATTATSATTADNATKLGGQTAAFYQLRCPAGTQPALGECFETTLRAVAAYSTAMATCGAAGRRVPTFGELEGARQNGIAVGVPPSNYELSASIDSADKSVGIDPAGNRLGIMYTDATKPYRCVALPTNTG
jgi:hypothetical protein